VVPTWNGGNPGLIILVGAFWLVALLLILADHKTWFSIGGRSKPQDDLDGIPLGAVRPIRPIARSIGRPEISGASRG
jgi:hypothetical protein